MGMLIIALLLNFQTGAEVKNKWERLSGTNQPLRNYLVNNLENVVRNKIAIQFYLMSKEWL